jgi:hypothetical protein
MANAALLIEWGMPRDGREMKAMEVFFSAMQKWDTWKGAGRISGFEVFGTLTGDYDTRSGFLIASGTTAQIAALQHSEDYRQEILKVVNIGRNVTVTACETGEAMTTRMQRYAGSLKGMGL